jgi:hypothetical protein
MGAGVEAGAANATGKAVHHGHFFSKIGRLGGAFLAGRPGADHNKVVFIRTDHATLLYMINKIIIDIL